MNVEVALMIVVALQIAFNVLMAYLLSCLNRETLLLHERIDLAEAAIDLREAVQK